MLAIVRMKYFEFFIKFCKGRVLSFSKNPWIGNPAYKDKIAWLEASGFVKKVISRQTKQIKFLVITDKGSSFFKTKVGMRVTSSYIDTLLGVI
jgi:hypothetical protein